MGVRPHESGGTPLGDARMAQVKTFPARLARERRRQFVRDNWWGLMIVVMLVAIGSLGGALLVPNVHIPLWSLLPAGFVLLAGFAYPMIDGTYHLWAADLAEGWTAADLRS